MNILEMAMAAKMGGGNGGGSGGGSGPIDPKRLPEGYPYKEGEKHEIVWDGNAEGKVNVEIDGEVIFTKVSDATPSVDELSPMYAQTADDHNAGNDPTELNAADIMTGNGCIYIIVGGAPTIVIAHEPNASINMGQMSLVFPEAGVYFGPFGHYGVTGYFCYGSETIHTMAPEFLPAGVGGGAYMMELKPSDYSMSSGGMVVPSISYDPILDALDKGQMVFIKVWYAEDEPMPYPMIVFYVAMDDNGYLLVNDTGGGVVPITFQTGKHTV